MFVACTVRDGDLGEFFAHENHAWPPSLSDSGHLHIGKKSHLTSCLEEIVLTKDCEVSPTTDVTIIDGAAVLNMLKPRSSKTFGEYREQEFSTYIRTQLSTSLRVDLVWDIYKTESLKQMTRNTRGVGVRRRVQSNVVVPKNWTAFLRCNDNKIELFTFLGDINSYMSTNKQVISTVRDSVMVMQERDVTNLAPCNHEEADSRVMVHVADATKCGHKNILVRTVDTDVLVLAVVTYTVLAKSIDNLWLAFGTGKNFRYIPVHEIAMTLGPQKSLALPFFHSFTGCDTVSSFEGRGKLTAWETWNAYPEATAVFSQLSSTPILDDVDKHMDIIERFTILMYNKSSELNDVNSARRKFFTQGRQIKNIPPTRAALLQHTRRAAYQGGHVWAPSNLIKAMTDEISPEGWGWKKLDSIWHPVWTSLPQASKACRELIKCGCKRCKSSTCKCMKSNLSCTELCKCGGDCY